MSIGSTLRNVSEQLVRQFGALSTYEAVTPGVYNPSLGTNPETTVSTSLRVLLDQYSNAEFGGHILLGDIKGHLAAKSLATDPEPGDRLAVKGRTYRVVNADAVFAQEDLVLWTLQLRRT